MFNLNKIFRGGGLKGLFAGFGPRVCRLGPSVGLVISFYEVVKFGLHHYNTSSWLDPSYFANFLAAKAIFYPKFWRSSNINILEQNWIGKWSA